MKESFAAKGLLHTSGLYARRNVRATEDSEALTRKAGAILLTTTNTPEVCLWIESYNVLHGRTNNPYDSRRHSGGSSGGEGALLAAAGAAFGIGSDIAGSIRIPSHNNGVFGLLIVPFTNHMPQINPDTYTGMMTVCGPMARFAEDIETIFKVMGGVEAEKILASPTVPLNRLRVFYQEGITPASIRRLSNSMRDALRKTVHHFVVNFDIDAKEINLDGTNDALDMWMASVRCEGQPTVAEFMANGQGEINPVREILKYPFTRSVHTLGTLISALSEKLFTYEGEKKKKRDLLRTQIIELLGEDGVLFFPTAPQTADYHNAPLLKPAELMYTALWNALALPALVCPVEKDANGLPLTVQVIGSPNSDCLLIKVGKEIERAFGGWQLPVE